MAEEGALYSPTVGLIFVFNLIVGTGALTMPKAFQDAGWLLSVILVVLIAFTSYATVTLVIEAMACANALLRREKEIGKELSHSEEVDPILSTDSSEIDEKPLLHRRVNGGSLSNYYSLSGGSSTGTPLPAHYFDIVQRVELGQMVSLFFNKFGVAVFYIVMVIYLYGDLAIYSAAVPKSLRDVVCTYRGNGSSCNNSTLDDSALCWPGVAINRMSAYRLFVALFTLLLGPFVFFNVQKTMLLQVVTTVMRWIAFISMAVLACIQLGSGQEKAAHSPPVAVFAKAPNLFGVCVYAFMCHHSLPSLVTPIRTKKWLLQLFAADFVLILCFYLLLSLTGSFAFQELPDLYTLTFEPNSCSAAESPASKVVFLQYFLALYPVFTISASYPIIGITLRNNFKALVLKSGRSYPWAVDRLVFPFVVLLPPLAVSLATNDLQFLVGITGSYAGVGIQYFIPIALAVRCRRTLRKALSNNMATPHAHQSPFNRLPWLIVLGVWAAGCVIVVTYNHVATGR